MNSRTPADKDAKIGEIATAFLKDLAPQLRKGGGLKDIFDRAATPIEKARIGISEIYQRRILKGRESPELSVMRAELYTAPLVRAGLERGLKIRAQAAFDTVFEKDMQSLDNNLAILDGTREDRLRLAGERVGQALTAKKAPAFAALFVGTLK